MHGDKRPIGIFDSGVGGLTVMRAVMRLLPRENLVYFGDTAHVPYGSKSKEVVTGFSLAIASFLRKQNVKMIVVACNTASAFALPELQKKLDIPVIGVIEPGSVSALLATENGRVGVIGTEGTIRSGSYTNAIRRMNPRIKVFGQPCPLFVPLVEEGWLDHRVTRMVASEYLAPLLTKGIDTLVLGCTHYPLIKPMLKRAIGPKVQLIDSAEATARGVQATLKKLGLLNESGKKGSRAFFVSDAPAKFQAVGQRFLGIPVAPVKKVTLD